MNASGLVQALVQHSLLLCAALLAAATLATAARRWLGAPAAYLSWLLVPLVLLSSALPKPSVESPLIPETAAAVAALQALSAEAVATLPSHKEAQVKALPFDPNPLLLLGWGAGAAALALLLVSRQHRFTRGLQRQPGDAHWTLPAGASPGAVGLWRPRLALPQDFEQRFKAEERALILAHEAVHMRRHDNAWNLLAHLLLLANWFNPMAWWALARMRRDQELACDAAVLAGAGEPDAPLYARALLKSQGDDALPALVSMWRPTHPLIERVSLLARHRKQSARRLGGQALVSASCLATAALVYASQPLPDAPAGPLLGPHTAVKPGHSGLTYRIRSKAGDEPWRDWIETMQLPDNKQMYGITPNFREFAKDKSPLWCVELSVIHFADHEIRLDGRLLDASCKGFLAEPQTVPQDGRSVIRLAGKTAQNTPVLVEITARLDRDKP